MRMLLVVSSLLLASCVAASRPPISDAAGADTPWSDTPASRPVPDIPPCGAVVRVECSDANRDGDREVGLLCALADEGATVYHFEWMRSFHNPIVLELQHRGDGYRLSAKRYDGAAGFGWGEVDVDTTVAISAEQWQRHEALVDSMSFWSQLPLSLDDFRELTQSYARDGSWWSISGARDGRYESMSCPNPAVVSDRFPEGSPMSRWGLYLLRLVDLVPATPREIY